MSRIILFDQLKATLCYYCLSGSFYDDISRRPARGTNPPLAMQNHQLLSLKFNILKDSIREQEVQNLMPDCFKVFLNLSSLHFYIFTKVGRAPFIRKSLLIKNIEMFYILLISNS